MTSYEAVIWEAAEGLNGEKNQHQVQGVVE